MAGKFDKLPKARLVSRKNIARGLMIIKIKPEARIEFESGQYCTIVVDDIARPYSVVSAPSEEFLEFFIELVPNGELTSKLWQLQVGEMLRIAPKAKGRFLFQPNYKNHLMVSTVTGIASFVSMLRRLRLSDYNQEPKRERCELMIFHGASYQDEFGYSEELSAMSDEKSLNLTYIPTVSRPSDVRNSGWSGTIGRVNQVFEDFLNRTQYISSDTIVYACGHPGMIEKVKKTSQLRGLSFQEESYFRI